MTRRVNDCSEYHLYTDWFGLEATTKGCLAAACIIFITVRNMFSHSNLTNILSFSPVHVCAPAPVFYIYVYIMCESLYNKGLRFSRPKVVSFYHCAARLHCRRKPIIQFCTQVLATVAQWTRYRMMRKIPSSMDRVAFCVPLAVFASSNNASYFCVIPPKKDIFFPYIIRVLLLLLCAPLILTICMYIYT